MSDVSFETLSTWLAREAEAECARIAEEALAEATEIERQAEAGAERALAALAARLRAETEAEIDRRLASVKRARRERILLARAALEERVFGDATRLLATLPLERYRQRLPELVTEVLRYLEHGPATLSCRPEVAAALDHVAAEGRVRIVPSEGVAAGVIGRSDDGRTTVDNTWPARLARQRSDLAIGLIARVEGTADDALG